MLKAFVCAVLTVRLRVAVAVCWGRLASCTLTTTDAVPTALCAGVPVIVPEVVLIERPLGSPVALKVYGAVPPVAATVAL